MKIAVIGQGCVLPGVSNPEELWEAVAAGRDLVSTAPPERWGVSRDRILGPPGHPADHTWSDRGGYVTELPLSPEHEGLDPLFHLALEAARQALNGRSELSRCGAIFGNLSFPSSSMSRFAEGVWLGELAPEAVDPRNRFMSGFPAHWMARTLGLGGPAFALDAACASSLYALKYACDALEDRRADLMLAGAVNRADDLFIHVGFCALKAMSETGQSRPFNAGADGLVPAEGSGFVLLKRLEDAQRDGDEVLAVIRGIGLSNDGRGRGMLAPAAEGQERAIRAAWEQAGLDPKEVGLIECHATGTVVGDRTEIESMSRVFGADSGLPIGSLKSNMGHLITAAGVAGLIKIIGAMKHRIRPPTLHVDEPLSDTRGFRLLAKAEPWEGPLRAGLSAFGFGGNNAHVVVESPEMGCQASAEPIAVSQAPVAVIGLGIAAGAASDRDRVSSVLFDGVETSPRADAVRFSMRGLRFPPKDLEAALPQQLLLLQAALEATSGLDLPRERTAVFVGMGADCEVCRYGARWRVPDWAESWGLDAAWGERARESFVPVLESAGVVGTMPNIPANRLNSQLDVAGPSHAVSAEELSGLRALELALRALRAGEVDVAIVGASDLSAEPVHEAATRALGIEGAGGDAAVVLVLKRQEDVADDAVWALFPAESADTHVLIEEQDVAAFGRPHAALGLLQVAAGALVVQRGRTFCGAETSAVRIQSTGLEGPTLEFSLVAAGVPVPPAPTMAEPVLRFPAHWQAVRLPELGAESAPLRPLEAAGPQIMEPAPALPPIVDVPADPPPMPVVPKQPVRPRAPAARPAVVSPGPIVGARVSPAAQPSPLLAELAAQQAQLSATHSAFLANQAALHQRFLQLRESSLQGLLQGRGQAPSFPATPLPTPAQPPISVPTPAPEVVVPPEAPPAPLRSRAPVPAQAQTPEPGAPEMQPTGLSLTREQLKVHASGRISEIFGAEFERQDGYERQVRMPEPPLLLADRVTGLKAEPGSMGKGTIWTETDVRQDSWYLHDARIPAGVMIESGQADLMLISYLGIDFLNQSERVYRLLGCELTYGGGLPEPGDTLCYDIHCDGHANQGPIRLFFFHYDCRVDGEVRLSVRGGQAGFFTAEELDDSKGILWTAEEQELAPDPRLDEPTLRTEKSQFTREELEAFSHGEVVRCFGEGFFLASTHTRTPRISGGRMLFLETVDLLDHEGGPWGRGYLKASDPIAPDDWFFDGHFKNDPCMPGTLMFEGCLQAMAFYLTSLGYTLDKDGWRFEPVPGESFSLRCRGQVLPTSKHLTYEIFVEEVHDGPFPTLYADLLCTVDGLKAFHCRRMGLRLVPGWPLDSRPELIPQTFADGLVQTKPAAVASWKGSDFVFDYASLMSCAWAKPSHAFGPMYSIFDETRKVARLPGPPYHFMSRLTSIEGELGSMRTGERIELEYDVPPTAWYFRENGSPTMPFCVLLEAALQPCGWLASFVGSACTTDIDLFFRNLDGTGTLHKELLPDFGTLRTAVTITAISQSGGMIIEGFELICYDEADEPVYTLKTVFGFFPKEALDNQKGLPILPEHKAVFERESDFLVDLTRRPEDYCGGPLRLASPYVLMIDRVTGCWDEKTKYRAEKDVNPDEWFFKAHFYQDPVQPGSLGIEAMIQLLQFAMLDRGMHEGISEPRFEPLMLGEAMSWKYRGQVRTFNKVIGSTLEITETGRDERGVWAKGKASLWVDGMRIYEAENLGVRIVSGAVELSRRVITLEPEGWLADHRPTWTVPALPMMSMVARLVDDARRDGEGRLVVGLRDVRVKRWLPVAEPTDTWTTLQSTNKDLRVTLHGPDGPVCEGLAEMRNDYTCGPQALAPLDAPLVESPYESGALFHGPSFQVMTGLRRDQRGASAILQADRLDLLLDGATHLIAHDSLVEGLVCYPAFIPELRFSGPAPLGRPVRCEVRPDGFLTPSMPAFRVEIIDEDRLWCSFRLVEAGFPKGPIGSADPEERRAFLRDRLFVPGLALSTLEKGRTVLAPDDVDGSDWLPGTVEALYGTRSVQDIAEREHLAHKLGVHPSVATRSTPLNRFPRITMVEDGKVVVRDEGPEELDVGPVAEFWTRWFDRPPWPVEDLYYGLIQRFVRRVVTPSPEQLQAVSGRSVLYLANHQTGVESLLFSIVASGLLGVPTVTLAKAEHRQTWLGKLIAHCFEYPGVRDPRVIQFFDREDQASLPRIIGELAEEMRGVGRSVMVHIEGTRSLECRTPVQKMSGAFIDMALAVGAPIVPVRFVGGLPAEPLEKRIEFPCGGNEGMGTQDIWLGRPLLAEELAPLPYGERKRLVIAAINALGPSNATEQPNPGDAAFLEKVEALQQERGLDQEHAALACVLEERPDLCDESRRVLDGKADSPWLRELARRLGRP